MNELSTTDNSRPATIGAVCVIGGGVGGIQTSLDLAANGYKVYLVEEKPAIGGVMAQLDKTFPTNDCSMCILSPKLVDVARNPNIELMTHAVVRNIDGEAGNFRVTVQKKARYVNADCVGCGLCAEACVLAGRLPNLFDEGMKKRGAIYIPYPQAVPLQFIVDQENCLYLKHGKCAQKCIDACSAKAIDFHQVDEDVELDVGAVILSPGYEMVPGTLKSEYGYGRYPNVLTSLEFERMLSASGPYGGHVVRPSDEKEPEKIAWIQCVGSRDNACGNNYCSSVCCTYAIKEAIIAKEHLSTVKPSIFYMDMRTHGKGFERYYNNAKDHHGIRFIRSRVSDIQEDPGSSDLLIRFESEDGELTVEKFDLVILSLGFQPGSGIRTFAREQNIGLNEFGFCDTDELTPMDTSIPGIFVCGAFSGPKDIPETVMQASGAAARASGLISSAKNTMVEKREFPEEIDVTGKEPRIGVFVCHCGINIGAYVNVPEVAEYAGTLDNVVFSGENIYSCSQDTQQKMVDIIREHDLNRVIVASCTPRTHEPLFRETVREAGLNPYLFEMANIRDQCSWVHMQSKEEATEKSKDLLRMAVAKARLIQPLPEMNLEMSQKGLVIGGGLAGMTSALAMAEQGYEVHLVEKETGLGGKLATTHYTLRHKDIQEYQASLVRKVIDHPLITVYPGSVVETVGGHVGKFISTIISGETKYEIDHGVIIVATGAKESSPKEYLFGSDPNVMTQSSLETSLSEGMDFTGRTVVMIQCVGSREEGRPYCSRVCCINAVKNSIAIKEKHPDAQVYVLYRDMRTYGFSETYYEKARELGVIFIRYSLGNKPDVCSTDNGLQISCRDHILGEDIIIDANTLVLSPAIIPRDGNGELAKLLKVPLNEDGFFLEAHVKLRPVDFSNEGIFVSGMAHSPKTIEESISQAYAAASRACTLMAKGTISIDPTISQVDEDLCIGCGLCVSICPSKALDLQLKDGGKKAVVIAASCKGCGICGASCPRMAITMRHFTDLEIIAQIDAYGEVVL